MISDEGQMRAARTMLDATDKMDAVITRLHDEGDFLIRRLEEVFTRFELAVELLLQKNRKEHDGKEKNTMGLAE